jgi:three-Cys-motif partner protein
VARGRSSASISGTFGGAWTEVKLDKISRYLAAYVKVMKNTPFITMYVDAFAGTGFMRPIQAGSDLFSKEEETVPAGSARLALDVSPPFSHYVFIEKNKARHQRLTA